MWEKANPFIKINFRLCRKCIEAISAEIILFILNEIVTPNRSSDLRTNGQFPRLANAIWGKDSYLPGVKKIVGGLLAADITHSKCGQKMLCDEMAPAVFLKLHNKF